MTGIRAALLAIAIAFSVAACEKELTREDYVANAEAQLLAGNQQAAVIELKNAAAVAPFDVEVRHKLALLYIELGLGADAEKEARRAQEMGLPESEAALLIARALMLQGAHERLIEETDEFAIDPTPVAQAEIMALRGIALTEIGEFDLAAETLRVAVEMDDTSALALTALGSLGARTGNLDLAREWIDRALQADPDSPEALAMQGDIFVADGELEKARAAYNRSIKQRGYVTLVNARRAMLALRMGDIPAANQDLALLRQVGLNTVPYVRQVRGLLLYQQSDFLGASVEFEKAVQDAPDNIPLKIYLASSYLQEGRREQAAQIIGQLYALVPDADEVAQLRTRLAVQNADLVTAEEILRDALATSGDDNLYSLGMLGALALLQGDPDAGVGHFERLLELDPDNENAQDMLQKARIQRGDFIERDLTDSGGTITEEQYEDILLSAASAITLGRLEEAARIAQNLHQQYPSRTGPLKLLATKELIEGDFTAGREIMEQILERDAYDRSTTRNLAQVYGVTGDEQLAVDLLERYLEAEPDDSYARALLSGLVVRTAEGDAVARLEDLLAADPANHAVRARLAKLRFDAGEYGQVVVLTEGLEPDLMAAQPILPELRGKALANRGDYRSALGVWAEWARAAPGSALAHYYHAEGLAAAGRAEEALTALQQSVELDSSYLPARLELVRTTAQSGELSEARELMDQLVEDVGGDNADVAQTEGSLAVREKRYDVAAAAFRRSLAAEPSVETALLLAVTLSTQGKPDEAMAVLEQWRTQYPDDLALLSMLAQGYVANEPGKAAATYEHILSVAPNSILALNNLAWLRQDSDLEAALGYARRAHDIVPEEPTVLDTYGNLLVASGEVEAGVNMLAEAVERAPDNLTYRLHYGRALARQGRTEAALEQLRLAAGAAEGSETATEARALLDALPAG